MCDTDFVLHAEKVLECCDTDGTDMNLQISNYYRVRTCAELRESLAQYSERSSPPGIIRELLNRHDGEPMSTEDIKRRCFEANAQHTQFNLNVRAGWPAEYAALWNGLDLL